MDPGSDTSDQTAEGNLDGVVFSAPPSISGLTGIDEQIRHPVPYADAETDSPDAFPAIYVGERMVKAVRGNDNRLLLGVTGSIATGKSTVARMLEGFGAPIIDFDVLAREVVEPGKPAWRDIVSYFGEQVLLGDRTLDRRKLREIVFRDIEKRKGLEGFIHPRTYEEFLRLVEHYAARDPNAVIQGVVPLLIEVRLQPFFHHILMVYAPEEVQKKRLMERDGITEEMAANMIRSQLPVEDKKGYCDLLIDNSGSLQDTRRQVKELWEKLMKIQQKRKAEKEKALGSATRT